MTRTEDVDLFAGPGGWDEGIRALGIRPLGFEINPNACATATKAGHRRVQADIASLDPRMAMRGTRVRLLIASPPCQGFSMAGKGNGRDDAEQLLATIAGVHTREDLELSLLLLHATMADDRSLLVLEPLRWALALTPDFLAWEQVPAVLPIWQACAKVLEAAGYTTATGVLTSEQYGVPQTRRRAILVARSAKQTAKLGPARLPEPTHSRYHNRDPRRLDAGVLPWVSMAEALGWGMTERPSMTVTGGGSGTGGAEPFGNGARQSITRERDAGRWEPRTVMCSAGRTAPTTGGQVPRDPYTAPSATITGKGTAAWVAEPVLDVVRTGQQTQTSRAGDVAPYERDVAAPAPTVTGTAGRWMRSNYAGSSGAGRVTAAERGRTMRHGGQPAVAITGKPPSWTEGNDHVRVTIAEAAVLQSFPADYPWQGNKGQQYQQVGDAVPPGMARAVVAEVTGSATVEAPAEGAA